MKQAERIIGLALPHAWRMLAVLGKPAAMVSDRPEVIAPLIMVLQDWSEENWDWLGALAVFVAGTEWFRDRAQH